jgi:Domain of unknown function (DUF4189)
MLPRFLAIVAFAVATFALPSPAQASRICNQVQVGETPPQVIGLENNNTSKPIYGPPQPIYEEQCVWKYGAVAVDPSTRTFSAAWNYDDIDAAKNYVIDQCGSHCAWTSFGEDFAYIAMSDDDRISGYSTTSSAEAERQCAMSGGVDCATVVAASSTANTLYWYFGAVAFDAATGATGASWSYARKGEAHKAALQSCAVAGCWAYAFQTGNGGMALADDGTLFGGWSARSEESAGKVALKDCEKAKGKKSCSIVYTGNALSAPKFKPKVPKKKKSKKGEGQPIAKIE